MLVILIFVTSAYQHNIARASDICEPPEKALNTEPVTRNYSLNSSIRIQCVAGYVRKVGTSNLFRCLKKHDKDKPSWTSALPLVCIRKKLIFFTEYLQNHRDGLTIPLFNLAKCITFSLIDGLIDCPVQAPLFLPKSF